MKRMLVGLVLLLASCTAIPAPADIAETLVSQTVTLVTAEGKGFCSGVVVSKNEVLTAAHCDVRDQIGGQIFVRSEGVNFKAAQVVWKDDALDLMVMTVEGLEAPVATRGDPWALRRGDVIYLVGAPYGELEFSFAVGRVGHTWRETEYGKFMQAYIESRGGNSGGPVFNERGELVGILTRGDPGGLSLFVPLYLLAYEIADA